MPVCEARATLSSEQGTRSDFKFMGEFCAKGPRPVEVTCREDGLGHCHRGRGAPRG